MWLDLSFLASKRFVNNIGNTSAFNTGFLTALQKFYAKRQGVSLDSVAVERWGTIWERMEFEGLVIGSRLDYFYFGTPKLAELTIRWVAGRRSVREDITPVRISSSIFNWKLRPVQLQMFTRMSSIFCNTQILMRLATAHLLNLLCSLMFSFMISGNMKQDLSNRLGRGSMVIALLK